MNTLQSAVIEVLKNVAARFGKTVNVSEPKYSKDFRSDYIVVYLPEASITGSVFPKDANFWNSVGLDKRFERIDFQSDAAMCNAIAAALTEALMSVPHEKDGGPS